MTSTNPKNNRTPYLRVIVDGAHDPYRNMAIDESLMLQCPEQNNIPVVRFYQWSIPSVSIGYFQSATEILSGIEESSRYTLVRRPTGGGAVLHDNDVTFSIIFPENLLRTAVIDSYRMINESIIRCLTGNDGISLHDDDLQAGKQGAPTFCFNEPTRYDIIWKSIKIGGSAQRRRKGYVLHQSSFFYTKSPELFGNDITDEQEIRLQVRQSICQALSTLFAIPLHDDTVTDAETSCSERLLSSRYATEKWNFSR